MSLLGRYQESAALWSRLSRALPDSIPVRIAYAWNLRAASRAEEAVRVLREGLVSRDDPRLWDELARTLMALGDRTGEAIEAARRGVELGHSDRTLTTLARAQIAAGRIDSASATRELIRDPDSLRAIDHLLAHAQGADR